MAKKKAKKTVKASSNSELRSKDGSKPKDGEKREDLYPNPSGAGPSADSGLGSKAITFLRAAGAVGEDASFEEIQAVYEECAAVLDGSGLSDNQQRAVGVALASDFTLASLRDRAQGTQAQAGANQLGPRDIERVNAIRREMGNEAADQMEKMLIKAKQLTSKAQAQAQA